MPGINIHQPWALAHDLAPAYLRMYEQYMRGNEAHTLTYEAIVAALSVETEPYKKGAYGESNSPLRVHEGQNGKIAVLPIKGVMMKDPMCAWGTTEMAAHVREAAADEKIHGLVVVGDSPGGMVSGTPALVMAVRDFGKPTVGYVDSMTASACYWVLSQCDAVYLNAEDYNIVGSIGVMRPMLDMRPTEAYTGKVYYLRSTDSPDKARANPYEDVPKEELKAMVAEMTEIDADFMQSVVSARKLAGATVNTDALTGRTYGNDDALAMGLVDGYATLPVLLAQMDNGNQAPKVSGNVNHMGLFGSKKQTPEPSATVEIPVASLEGLGMSADEIKEPVAALAAATNKFAALEAEAAELTGQVASMTAKVAAYDKQAEELAAAQANVKTLSARVAELEAMPAGDPLLNPVAQGGGDVVEQATANQYPAHYTAEDIAMFEEHKKMQAAQKGGTN